MGSSVNNVSKSQTGPAAALASLAATVNHATDSLFTNLLSGIQPSAPSTSGHNASSRQSQQQQNNVAPAPAATNGSGDTANDGVSSPQTPVNRNHQSAHDAKAASTPRQTVKSGTDKSKARDAHDDPSGNNSQAASAIAPSNPPQSQPKDQKDTSSAVSCPAPQNPTASSGTDDATDNPVAAASLQQSAAFILPTLPVPASAVAPNTPAAPAAPGSSDASSQTADSGSAQNTDPTQLQLLQQQLEQLAAAQLQNAVQLPGAQAAFSNIQTANTAGSLPASNGGASDKTGLKDLLNALAAPPAFGTPVTDTAPSSNLDLIAGDNTADSNSGSATTQTPSSPATPPKAPSDKTNDTTLLNLFNSIQPANQNNAVPPPAPGVVSAALLNAGGGNADVGADARGQNGSDTHAGLGSPSLNTTDLMPQTGAAQGSSPYSFASELSAMRATKGGATGLPSPVEQVVLQLSRNLAKDGSSQMTIQLRPAELGRIDVKLSVDSQGKVQGTVTADNPTTLNLLVKDARGLERALQEAGLQTDPGSLQFNLRGDGQGGAFNQASGNAFANKSDTTDSGTLLPVAGDTSDIYYLTPGGVNMRV